MNIRKAFTLLMFFVLVNSINAQIIKEFGVYSGIYFSSQDKGYIEKYKLKMIGHIQTFSFSFYKKNRTNFNIQIGLIQEGLFTKENELSYSDAPLRHNYIYIYPTFQYSFIKKTYLSLNLLLSTGIKYNFQRYCLYYYPKLPKWIPEANIGLGVDYKLTRLIIRLNVIHNIQVFKYFDADYFFHVSNNSTMLNLGIVYPFTRN